MRNTKVKVSYQALRDYLEEYHSPRPNYNKPGSYCRADGQDWPCKTYREVYFAVHGEHPLTRPSQ